MNNITRNILLLACFTLYTSVAHAQIGEYRNYWTIGASGGVAVNKVSFYPTLSQKWHMGPTIGLTARYTSEQYFRVLCSLQLELNYTKLGWKENILLADGTISSKTPNPESYTRDIHYITIPLMARLALGHEHRGAQGFLLLGPQVGYAFNETEKHSDYWNPDDRINNRNQQYNLHIKNKFDYGITGGLGMEVSSAVGRFQIEGRYYFGLANLFGASKKDPFGRSANGAIIGKIGYMLPNNKTYKSAKK